MYPKHKVETNGHNIRHKMHTLKFVQFFVYEDRNQTCYQNVKKNKAKFAFKTNNVVEHLLKKKNPNSVNEYMNIGLYNVVCFDVPKNM
jgi:TPP-dependent 2-oxoacid decarboxylase